MTAHVSRIPMAALAIVGLFAVPVHAVAAGTVVGSKHDLRATGGGGTAAGTGLTEVCASCHTPHQPATVTQDPLWNHTVTATANFGVYASDTMSATPTDIGGGSSVSLLCMSCHDGTVSVVSMYNPPNSAAVTPAAVALRIDSAGKIISNANMGISLANDHPVNFSYTTAQAADTTGLKASPLTVRLFGTTSTVQCASCHNVHNPENGAFLIMGNTASALCLTCHTK